MELQEIRNAYKLLKYEFSASGHQEEDVELEFFVSNNELFVRDTSPKAIKSALILAERQNVIWMPIATDPLILKFIYFLSDNFSENRNNLTQSFAAFLNSYFKTL